MGLTSFCGLLTLQVGAAILAAVFFALAGVILAANIFDYHTESVWFPFSLILMIIFVVGLIIAAALMFASSYGESRSLAIMAVIVIVILLCYWLILCAFSFLSHPDHVSGVCIDTRCPESFWIGNLRYRRQHLEDGEGEGEPDEGNGDDKPAEKGGEEKVYDVVNEDRFNYIGELKRGQEYFEINEHKNIANFVSNQNRENNSENESSDYHQRVHPFAKKKEERWLDGFIRKPVQGKASSSTTQNPKTKGTKKPENGEEEPSRYVFGFPMIGAIILFIINLIFLLFSAFVMYSWAQELSWADYYYYDDDPVVLVEDY